MRLTPLDSKTSKSYFNKNLNEIFFQDLEINKPDFYLDAAKGSANLKFIVSSYCKKENVKVLNYELTDSNIAFILTCFDITSIIVSVVFYRLIIFMQNDFSTNYDNQTIEARDFCLKIHKLPPKYKQLHTEHSLQFAIWDEIQKAFDYAIQTGIVNTSFDRSILSI